MTAIADFEHRWRQTGKTLDCSFKQTILSFKPLSYTWCNCQ